MGIKLSLDSLFGPDDSLPKCAYGCGYDDEEMLFRHKGELGDNVVNESRARA